MYIYHKPCFKASSRNVKLSAKEPWNIRKHKRRLCTLVKTGIIGTVVGMEFLDKTFEEWISHLKRIFNTTKSQKQQQIQGICGTCYCSTFLLFEETSRSPFQILTVNTRWNLNANINHSMLIFFFKQTMSLIFLNIVWGYPLSTQNFPKN